MLAIGFSRLRTIPAWFILIVVVLNFR